MDFMLTKPYSQLELDLHKCLLHEYEEEPLLIDTNSWLTIDQPGCISQQGASTSPERISSTTSSMHGLGGCCSSGSEGCLPPPALAITGEASGPSAQLDRMQAAQFNLNSTARYRSEPSVLFFGGMGLPVAGQSGSSSRKVIPSSADLPIPALQTQQAPTENLWDSPPRPYQQAPAPVTQPTPVPPMQGSPSLLPIQLQAGGCLPMATFAGHGPGLPRTAQPTPQQLLRAPVGSLPGSLPVPQHDVHNTLVATVAEGLPGQEAGQHAVDAAVASLPHLAYLTPPSRKKNKGGRQPAADPRLDPSISSKRAKRILANRLAAAKSKLKKKTAEKGLAVQLRERQREWEGMQRELITLMQDCAAAEYEQGFLRAQLQVHSEELRLGDMLRACSGRAPPIPTKGTITK